MSHVRDKTLMDDKGKPLGTFSSHWAAVAAMLRQSDPSFRSLSGDKAADLEIEKRINKKGMER